VFSFFISPYSKTFAGSTSKHSIPYPYPKTDEEIIADLKFQVKQIERRERNTGCERNSKDRLLGILEDKTSYRVGKIVKVMNRKSSTPMDYFWLIFIMDKDDGITLFIHMDASGVLSGGFSTSSISKEIGRRLLFTRKEILDVLTMSLKGKIVPDEVKKIERVGFGHPVRQLWAPMWEITLNNGNLYYYSALKDKTYKIKKIIPWRFGPYNVRERPEKLAGDEKDFVVDSANDIIIILEAL
jgi:hypothetical protein